MLWSLRAGKDHWSIPSRFSTRESTTDQTFILKTVIDKHLFRKRGRFYCLFADFSKAFDTVNHDFLIYLLIKSGMHGKVLTITRKVYSKVTAAVCTQNGLT